MRTAVLTILAVAGIILGFFLTACSGVMFGLAAYKATTEGVGSGFEMLLQAWPLFLGSLVCVVGGWIAFRLRSGRPAAPHPQNVNPNPTL